MTMQADSHRPTPEPSSRVHRVVTAVRAAEFRRTRRAILSVVTCVVLVGAWHLVPRWRMNSLRSEVERLDAYRAAQGRYPLSQAELDAALGRCSFGGLWRKAEFKGDPLDGMGLKYRPYDGGSGFTLHFNHDCFCEPFDTSRYEYTSGDDSWAHWCD